MRPVAFALALAVMTAAAPGLAAEPSDLSMEIYSWGKLMRGWSVHPDGSAELRSVGSDTADDTVEVRRLPPAQSRYNQVSAALQGLRSYVGKPFDCGPRMTDAPYGYVRWKHGNTVEGLDFNYGCTSETARKLLTQINYADGLLGAEWDKATPVESAAKP